MSDGEEAAAPFPAEVKKPVEEKGCHSKQVFGCDDTGRFWKMLSATYIRTGAEEAPGHEVSQDRVTRVLWCQCLKAWVKPGMVYRAKNSRALKMKSKKISSHLLVP